MCALPQECRFFVPSTRHLWLFLEVFSQTPSLTVLEYIYERFSLSGVVMVVKCVYPTRPIFTALRNANSCFSTLEIDGGEEKKLPLNYLQKHKHMPEEFESNNLPPWSKLWASCMKTGRPHHFSMIFMRSRPRQGPPLKQDLFRPNCYRGIPCFHLNLKYVKPSETSKQSSGSHIH